MSRHIKIAPLTDLPPGQMKLLSLAGVGLAVFNIDGRYYAIRNRCPHEGGPVATGPLQGTMITCPRHGWQFDVTTGQNKIRPSLVQHQFEVKVEGGEVLVAVP